MTVGSGASPVPASHTCTVPSSNAVTSRLALVLASVLFGAAHLITWTSAIIAALIAAYLVLLWIWTGNLLTPMITHAVYDFAALVYFLRVYRGV